MQLDFSKLHHCKLNCTYVVDAMMSHVLTAIFQLELHVYCLVTR